MAFDGLSPENTEIDLAEVDASNPSALREALGDICVQNNVMAARMPGMISEPMHPAEFYAVYGSGDIFKALQTELGPAAPVPKMASAFNNTVSPDGPASLLTPDTPKLG